MGISKYEVAVSLSNRTNIKNHNNSEDVLQFREINGLEMKKSDQMFVTAEISNRGDLPL